MENNKDFLGTQPVGKLLFKLAIPTVIAQLINMLYNIVDRIFIGHIPDAGSLALTGVGVTMPIIMIVSAFAGLVSSGGAPRASISMGKGNMDSAEQTLGGCFLLQVIVSIILTAVLLLFGENLLLAFGASENTIEYAVSYLNIYALGTLFVQLTLGMNAFVTAEAVSYTHLRAHEIYKSVHGIRRNRCNFEYRSRPDYDFWIEYGCAWCCFGNCYFAGSFMYHCCGIFV